jgi:WXXGXW repeat (2 copies)
MRKLLLLSAVVLFTASTSNAQIEVNIRPARPHYERTAAPGHGYVWVDEDWREVNGKYEFAGGHWVKPPRPNQRWVPGHWDHGHHGQVWRPGHWR